MKKNLLVLILFLFFQYYNEVQIHYNYDFYILNGNKLFDFR